MKADHHVALALALGCGAWLSGCGSGESGARGPSRPDSALDTGGATEPAKVLNLFIWSDYLAAHTLENFQQKTGIKVHVAYFDTNETLETRLLAGHSGFDVVVPSADYFERQIKAGAYLTLDKSKLPNLGNMDPQLMAKVSLHDPGNAHGVIYLWASNGIGYNEKKIKALMPDAPLDSWRLLFDPTVASKLSRCGISVLDSPVDLTRAALAYLGRDTSSRTAEDLTAVEAALLKIRPYLRDINSSNYIEALANGDVCLALGYSGDVLQARDRAREASKGIDIRYVVPKEGSTLAFDMLAIPKDAPNPESAHAFINYLMIPQVIADITNFKRYANANAASLPLLDPDVRNDPAIYPSPALRQILPVVLSDTPEQTRAMTRMWQRIKTGQ